MHNHLRYLLIGSSLVLGACEFEDDLDLEQLELEQPEAGGDPTQHAPADEIDPGSGAEAVPVNLQNLDPDCVDVRAPIIARTTMMSGSCEFPGFQTYFASEWEATKLFIDGSPLVTSIVGGAVPSTSPLKRYCRYDYIGNDVDPWNDYVAIMTAIQGPRSGIESATAATDCPVMLPMTDQGLDTAAGRQALHEAFMANINAVSAADLEGVDLYPTRLTLLDTVAEGVTPYNEHGLQLESLIADITCPGDPEACLDSIHHVLVTPRVPEDNFAAPDWDGGNVGYMHEFSMGLMVALMDWRQDNYSLNVDDRERLVISAAIGADPSHPIAGDQTLAPAMSAVDALNAAYCMGAVVYAAAGNVSDLACQEEEMLAPAIYEEFVVPTQAQCGTWGYAPMHPGYTYEPNSPLVRAVGGLDGHDQPIANHRRTAHPWLHATASDAISSDGTVAISGTSVATAVVAATHYLMWSVDPHATADDMHKLMYDAGYETNVWTDSGANLDCTIHRLSVCHSLDQLLNDLDCGSGAPDPDANLDDYLTAINAAIAEADLDDLLIPAGSTIQGSSATCLPSPEPFIKPQPERPVCSNCNGDLAASGNVHMLNMSIMNQSWSVDLDVTAAKLYTYDANGIPTVFDLAAVVPSINAAIPTNVIQVSFEAQSPVSAALQFTYYDAITDTYTKQSNPIPLL